LLLVVIERKSLRLASERRDVDVLKRSPVEIGPPVEDRRLTESARPSPTPNPIESGDGEQNEDDVAEEVVHVSRPGANGADVPCARVAPSVLSTRQSEPKTDRLTTWS
jgi:hypothetical protein